MRSEQMTKTIPKQVKRYRHTNQSHRDLCWRLKQKYDRYRRTGTKIGVCQEVGRPDDLCPLFGDPAFRVGKLGRNRACTACGRYWIS